MIYVNKDTQIVEIPKSGNIGQPRQLRLLNQLTNIDIYTEVEDLGNDPIMYAFNIESIVKDLVVGQYDYFILDANGSVLDNGILQYDSFNSRVSAYSLDDPKVIQYSLGDAYTPIPETTFTVFTDGVYDTDGIDKIIVKTKPDEPDEPVVYPEYLVFTNTSQVTINNNLQTAPNLEYSFDRDNWVTIEFPKDTSILDIATEDKPIYFRGDNPDGFDNAVVGNKYLTFVSDGEVAGNIMSILDPTCESVTLPNSYCFGRLFYGSRITSAANLILPADQLVSNAYYQLFCNCANLNKVPELPATKLAMQCYMYMFANCKSLTKAPVLPANTLAPYCYQYMFQGCTILTQAPELPAMNLAERCYESMFKNCTALHILSNLPATTLVDSCYGSMFSGCVCITSDDLPELPATTLAPYCYQYMFSGCTGLTQAPSLPATTLAEGCYRSMFTNCTNLTTTPNLSAKIATNSCYKEMFLGCKSLTTAPKLSATTIEDRCYEGMFSGCINLTQAPELPATTIAMYCYQSMFNGCTGLTQAPSLPATTLATSCYRYMFRGCTSLTKAPVLTATKLFSYCYDSMFRGCINLNYIVCRATSISAFQAIYNWVNKVAETGTFKKSAGVEWPTGTSGIPTGWSVVEL